MIKQRIKNILKSWINNLLYENVSNLNNPFNINFKDGNSIVKMPSKIEGGEFLHIGLGSSIGRYSWIGAIRQYGTQKYYPNICVGNNVSIGNLACVTAINEITIGDNCLISEQVYISDHAHGFDLSENTPFIQQDLTSKGKVVIGKDCFIGFRVSILSGVQLGNFCIVGSHSVVNKSFPAYSMIAGSPAKLIKTYSLELNEWVKV